MYTLISATLTPAYTSTVPKKQGALVEAATCQSGATIVARPPASPKSLPVDKHVQLVNSC